MIILKIFAIQWSKFVRPKCTNCLKDAFQKRTAQFRTFVLKGGRGHFRNLFFFNLGLFREEGVGHKPKRDFRA